VYFNGNQGEGGITDLSHVTNMSQIVLKPAYFGLMVLKRITMENTEIPGKNRGKKMG
jgi:hypothetical protein